jgi:chemotaxis protein CheX
MAPALPITETIVRNSIVKAVQSICKTMMRRDATLRPPGSVATNPPTFHLMASVGFVGDANGVVFLCLRNDFARFATSEILGLGPEDSDANDAEIIKDAIGEIANMTVGVFKNQLCDIGFPCKLTLPTIVRGQDLLVGALRDASRHVFEFDCAGHSLTADIQLKAG